MGLTLPTQKYGWKHLTAATMEKGSVPAFTALSSHKIGSEPMNRVPAGATGTPSTDRGSHSKAAVFQYFHYSKVKLIHQDMSLVLQSALQQSFTNSFLTQLHCTVRLMYTLYTCIPRVDIHMMKDKSMYYTAFIVHLKSHGDLCPFKFFLQFLSL